MSSTPTANVTRMWISEISTDENVGFKAGVLLNKVFLWYFIQVKKKKRKKENSHESLRKRSLTQENVQYDPESEDFVQD